MIFKDYYKILGLETSRITMQDLKVAYRDAAKKYHPDVNVGDDKKISLRTAEGKMKTFAIKVPAGIRDNEKVRLLGQGKAGINGGKNGDLFIKIKIEDNKQFQLKGFDLYTDLCITPWEAALGTRDNVSSIDDTASIYVPQGIQSRNGN